MPNTTANGSKRPSATVPESPSAQPRKRQRPPSSCQRCRKRKARCDKASPKCTNCVKSDNTCIYERFESTLFKGESSFQIDTTPKQTTPFPRSSKSTTKKQAQVMEPEQSQITQDILFTNESINLFQKFPTLELKASLLHEARPLNHLSFVRRDPYFSIFKHFTFLHFRLGRSVIEEVNSEDWKSTNIDGSNRWLSLGLVKKYSPELTDFFLKITKDRNDRQMVDFTGLCRASLCYEGILKEMKQALPSREVTQRFLEFFFEVMWCHFPIIDQDEFTSELSRIITYDPDTELPELQITGRFDLVSVALLLIILRYSSICMSLVPTNQLEKKYLPLQTTQISISTLGTAQKFINITALSNTPTIPILQCLLLLRLYQRDCPEGGDTPNPHHTQAFTGYLIQCALSLSLNREQNGHNWKMKNLKRLLWNVLTTVECESIVLNGAISCFPGAQFSDVSKPQLSNQEDLLEKAIHDECSANEVMNELYLEISNLFNIATNSTKVTDIERLIQKMAMVTNDQYKFQKLPPKSYNIKGLSHEYSSVVLRNTRYIMKRLIQYSIEIQVYHILCTHYSVIPHDDKSKYIYFLKKSLESIRNATDLCIAYINGKLDHYIPATSNFVILPTLNKTLIRAAHIGVSHILSFYHTTELLYLNEPSDEIKHKLEALNQLKTQLVAQTSYIIDRIYEKLSSKYWFALKVGISSKYSMSILTKHKFACISSAIEIFNGEDPINRGVIREVEVDSEPRKLLRDKLIQRKNVKEVTNSWYAIHGSNGKKTLVSKVWKNMHFEMGTDEISDIYEVLTGKMHLVEDFHTVCFENSSKTTQEPQHLNFQELNRYNSSTRTTSNSELPSSQVDNLSATSIYSLINHCDQITQPSPTANSQLFNDTIKTDIDMKDFDFGFFDDFNDVNDMLLESIFQGFS